MCVNYMQMMVEPTNEFHHFLTFFLGHFFYEQMAECRPLPCSLSDTFDKQKLLTSTTVLFASTPRCSVFDDNKKSVAVRDNDSKCPTF